MDKHIHDKNCVHEGDGIDNKEHFLDLFSETEMLYQNIKDNTDVVFNLLKNYEKDKDDDFVDVIKIDASEILEIEKLISPIFKELENIKNLIKNNEDYLKQKELIEKYFNFIKTNEEKSFEIINKLFKKLS